MAEPKDLNIHHFAGDVYVDGNAGIGTGTPSAKLHVLAVYDTDQSTESLFGGRGIVFTVTHAAAFTIDKFEVSQAGHIVVTSENTDLATISQIDINPEGIRLNNISGNVVLQESTGNVGVGITSPTAKFHAVGSIIMEATGENLKAVGLPVFADEAAAAALPTDTLYKTATGEIRIKL